MQPSSFARSRILFLITLIAFVTIYIVYGLKRFTLGVDFTDEGAYLSWPLRVLFGERPFASEIVTLTRPIEVFLFIPFKFHPAMSLYEFRLLGWGMHLTAFSILTVCLFRLSDAPLQSPLIASIPFFVCHIFGLAPPSYNTLSSDFFLITLSLLALASLNGNGSARNKSILNLSAGVALFVATLAHPALGLIAAFILVREFFAHDLARNLLGLKPSPSNIGIIAFVSCWLVFFVYIVASGAATTWLERIPLAQSFTLTSLHENSLRFFLNLVIHPFAYSRIAIGVSLAAFVAIYALYSSLRICRWKQAAATATLLALLLIASFIFSFGREPEFLTSTFALVCLLLGGALMLGPKTSGPWLTNPTLRFLSGLSLVGAVLYGTTTFYFVPHRSWMSGILALPFLFSIGLTLLLKTKVPPPAVLRILVPCLLVLVVVCVASNHYISIQRDASPSYLRGTFRIPKLAHIHSTEERTHAVEALYDYLHPKLTRGEPMLVFDNAPMLYYLFDAMPAYGMAWASRFGIGRDALNQLDTEFRSRSLPRFAVRTLVDLSNPIWAGAPRTDYQDYPINETLNAHYVLDETIFPFEIWRLRAQ
jgi:hypothetical protein